MNLNFRLSIITGLALRAIPKKTNKKLLGDQYCTSTIGTLVDWVECREAVLYLPTTPDQAMRARPEFSIFHTAHGPRPRALASPFSPASSRPMKLCHQIDLGTLYAALKHR